MFSSCDLMQSRIARRANHHGTTQPEGMVLSTQNGEAVPMAGTFRRRVWSVAEYRVLCAAIAVSVVGDQFARVGLSVLVYERSRSAGLTAATYALTYLPDVLASPLLSGLADRWPRRRVMVVADVLRAALVAVMAIPALPLPLVAALLVAVMAAGAPGNAARASTLAVVLPDADDYVLGKGVTDTIVQLGQVAGFAFGGVLIGFSGPASALLVDAVSFFASAVLVYVGIHRRPAPVSGDDFGSLLPLGRWWADLTAGTRLIVGAPRLRALVSLAAVAGCYITVEGLAAPYAAELHYPPGAVGWLLAASPAGTVLGMLVVSRIPAAARDAVMAPLAISACLPLLACALRPSLVVTVVLWAVSGMASSYHLLASAAFLRAVPDERRGQAFGLAATVLRTSQGLGIAMAGVVADRVMPTAVVAWAGGVGVLAACTAGTAWRRARRLTSASVSMPGSGMA